MRRATIKDVQASWGSGMLVLVVEDAETHNVVRLLGDNGPTVRALDAMFSCILPGHRLDTEAVIGQDIAYEGTDYGPGMFMLEALAPAEEAD